MALRDWISRSDEDGGWRSPYRYARDSFQESPTVFTAICTLLWCVFAVLSKMESISSVAGPAATALIFIANNVHMRKAHQEVRDALEEVRLVRERVERTRVDLGSNTDYTVDATLAASRAAASAERAVKLVAEINKKFDALHRGKE